VIRILILADILLYREGLAQLLGRNVNISVVATVARAEEALAGLATLQPDVVLLDMATPDSLATVRAIGERAPGVRVVALAVAETERDVLACAEAGVAGYVPRAASVDDLVAVLESIARGESLCSPRIAASLLRRIAALAAGTGSRSPLAQLTAREREIGGLIDRGFSNKEIATELHIEVATVKNHVHNLLEKLQVRRRGEVAARFASPRSLERI
jgi:two-component system nitrate/nitrite response regulator NarL